jgi:hypothetical protein
MSLTANDAPYIWAAVQLEEIDTWARQLARSLCKPAPHQTALSLHTVKTVSDCCGLHSIGYRDRSLELGQELVQPALRSKHAAWLVSSLRQFSAVNQPQNQGQHVGVNFGSGQKGTTRTGEVHESPRWARLIDSLRCREVDDTAELTVRRCSCRRESEIGQIQRRRNFLS